MYHTIKLILDPPPSPPGGCFPALAKVVTVNGKLVTMSELKKGDQVQTGISIRKFLLAIFPDQLALSCKVYVRSGPFYNKYYRSLYLVQKIVMMQLMHIVFLNCFSNVM